MGKSPLFSEFLELMVNKCPVLLYGGPLSLTTFLGDFKRRKYFLQVVDDTNDGVLAKLFYFKVLRIEVSLRKHPFLLTLRRWGPFARRNVCDSGAEIPYW